MPLVGHWKWLSNLCTCTGLVLFIITASVLAFGILLVICNWHAVFGESSAVSILLSQFVQTTNAAASLATKEEVTYFPSDKYKSCVWLYWSQFESMRLYKVEAISMRVSVGQWHLCLFLSRFGFLKCKYRACLDQRYLVSIMHRLNVTLFLWSKCVHDAQHVRCYCRTENAARRSSGEELLPEEDPNNPIFKTLPEPSRLDSYLITNQIANYCSQVNGYVLLMFFWFRLMQRYQCDHTIYLI